MRSGCSSHEASLIWAGINLGQGDLGLIRLVLQGGLGCGSVGGV